MPFHSHITTVSIFPHILSCVDPVNKNNYRRKYQKIKKYGSAVVSGLVIQFVSLPFYVFSYGSKLRRFALSVTKVGAKITKGEIGIVN